MYTVNINKIDLCVATTSASSGNAFSIFVQR